MCGKTDLGCELRRDRGAVRSYIGDVSSAEPDAYQGRQAEHEQEDEAEGGHQMSA
jgi:hypothetical protein